MKMISDEVLIEKLHELAGKCGHCGKVKCSEKRKYSVLPSLIKGSDFTSALAHAVDVGVPVGPEGKK